MITCFVYLRSELEGTPSGYNVETRHIVNVVITHNSKQKKKTNMSMNNYAAAPTESVENTAIVIQSIAADHQSTAADHKSTAADHRLTTADHHPTAVDHQPTAVDHQPTAVDHQPTAADHQPTAADHQSTTADPQSTAVDHQLAAAVVPFTENFHFVGDTIGPMSADDLVTGLLTSVEQQIQFVFNQPILYNELQSRVMLAAKEAITSTVFCVVNDDGAPPRTPKTPISYPVHDSEELEVEDGFDGEDGCSTTLLTISTPPVSPMNDEEETEKDEGVARCAEEGRDEEGLISRAGQEVAEEGINEEVLEEHGRSEVVVNPFEEGQDGGDLVSLTGQDTEDEEVVVSSVNSTESEEKERPVRLGELTHQELQQMVDDFLESVPDVVLGKNCLAELGKGKFWLPFNKVNVNTRSRSRHTTNTGSMAKPPKAVLRMVTRLTLLGHKSFVDIMNNFLDFVKQKSTIENWEGKKVEYVVRRVIWEFVGPWFLGNGWFESEDEKLEIYTFVRSSIVQGQEGVWLTNLASEVMLSDQCGKVVGAGSQTGRPHWFANLLAFPKSISVEQLYNMMSTFGINCVICMKGMKDGEQETVVLSCTHMLHKDCMAYWLRYNKSCPTCRKATETSCFLCKEEFRSPTSECDVKTLKCNHKFHNSCLIAHNQPSSASQCMACRNEVTSHYFLPGLHSGTIELGKLLGDSDLKTAGDWKEFAEGNEPDPQKRKVPKCPGNFGSHSILKEIWERVDDEDEESVSNCCPQSTLRKKRKKPN